MDLGTLRNANDSLYSSTTGAWNGPFMVAYQQAVRQFNALLMEAKTHYPDRSDIHSLEEYDVSTGSFTTVSVINFNDAVSRLRSAIFLQPAGSAIDTFAQIQLPTTKEFDLRPDMQELEVAIGFGLEKTVMLLCGSVAEALLLSRHPDDSERGQGLGQLVRQATIERMLGRDTLRYLDTLVDYRDLIHARAEKRNRTPRNDARIDSAVTTLKLLCGELEDPEARFEDPSVVQ